MILKEVKEDVERRDRKNECEKEDTYKEAQHANVEGKGQGDKIEVNAIADKSKRRRHTLSLTQRLERTVEVRARTSDREWKALRQVATPHRKLILSL